MGFSGRTAQEARCRYRRITDAQVRRQRGETFRNKCHTCGQPRRGHVCPGAPSITGPRIFDRPIKCEPVVNPVVEMPPPPPQPPKKARPAPAPSPDFEEAPDFEAPAVSDYEDEDDYPALPLSIMRNPSLMTCSPDKTLHDLAPRVYQAWNSSGVGENLRRLPSIGGEIGAFYGGVPGGSVFGESSPLRGMELEFANLDDPAQELECL